MSLILGRAIMNSSLSEAAKIFFPLNDMLGSYIIIVHISGGNYVSASSFS